MRDRRVLVTGIANALGTRLAVALLRRGHSVVGLDTREPPGELAGRVHVIDADVRAPEVVGQLVAARVDTIVHNDIVQFPEPGRPAGQLHDVNVVGTLQLLAGADALDELETFVVRSSAAIYGSHAAAPLYFTEDAAGGTWARRTTRFQRDVAELERLVETFARRHPAVTCTVLRMQPLVGADVRTPINALLHAPVVLTALGYDPRVQVIHADDAVGAMVAAVEAPVSGPINVAADGVASLHRILRRAGRTSIPVAAPLLGTASGLLARLTGGDAMPEDVLDYLRHGRGVALDRMHDELRFHPQLDTEAALLAVIGGDSGAMAA